MFAIFYRSAETVPSNRSRPLARSSDGRVKKLPLLSAMGQPNISGALICIVEVVLVREAAHKLGRDSRTNRSLETNVS